MIIHSFIHFFVDWLKKKKHFLRLYLCIEFIFNYLINKARECSLILNIDEYSRHIKQKKKSWIKGRWVNNHQKLLNHRNREKKKKKLNQRKMSQQPSKTIKPSWQGKRNNDKDKKKKKKKKKKGNYF